MAPLHMYRTPTAADAQTRLLIHRMHCTVSLTRGSQEFRFAPARDYTHYIHASVNFVSLHAHDRFQKKPRAPALEYLRALARDRENHHRDMSHES